MKRRSGAFKKDWNTVHELACDVVNVTSDVGEEAVRTRLQRHLNEMKRRYGPLPEILATQADYLPRGKTRESLLRRAYNAAVSQNDSFNELLIASSLARYYLDGRAVRKAKAWIEIHSKCLEKEYEEGEARENASLRSDVARLRKLSKPQLRRSRRAK
jgi:hypothetical protein